MTEGIVILLLGELFSIISLLVTNIIQNKSRDKKLTEEIKEIKDHQKKNYIGILRLTVMSEEMPVSERIIAGKKYIEEGGNGDVKKFYEKFVKEHTV